MQHRLNIERKFRNPNYVFPSRARSEMKVINYNFIVIKLQATEEGGDILESTEHNLYLRFGCAPLQRKEMQITLNNLSSAPIRR
jgi:hypothetical protein